MNPLALLVTSFCGRFSLPRNLTRWRCASRLASSNPRVVARAAGEIAMAARAGHERSLLRALQAWSRRDEPQARVVCLFVLDALVQTDAVVPATLLRPLLHGVTEVAAFALLARSARINESALLAWFRAETRRARGARRLQWVAAGNLLGALRTPGLAGVLLDDVDWRIVVAADGDEGDDASERGLAGVVCRDQPRLGAGGFAGLPLLPHHVLTAAPVDAPFADGVLAVRHRRTLGGSPPGGEVVVDGHEALVAAWLAVLAGAAVVPAFAVRVDPAGPGGVAAQVTVARTTLLESRRRLLLALRAAGALTPEEVVRASRPPRLAGPLGGPAADPGSAVARQRPAS